MKLHTPDPCILESFLDFSNHLTEKHFLTQWVVAKKIIVLNFRGIVGGGAEVHLNSLPL